MSIKDTITKVPQHEAGHLECSNGIDQYQIGLQLFQSVSDATGMMQAVLNNAVSGQAVAKVL